VTPEAEVRGAQAARTPRVSLRGIVKTFGSVEALRGVDLDLWPGECLGLVGDNAAGKSTLTKVLSGTYLPDAGTITMDGQPLALRGPADARAAGIEMVFQDLSLCDHIDVAGNLFLGREPTRGPFLDRRRMQADGRKMLEALEIRIPRLTARVEMLSGGQRQALAIARAPHWASRLVLMDEPTAALGVAATAKVEEHNHKLKERGAAVRVVRNNNEDVLRIPDRVTVHRRGKQVGTRRVAETSHNELVSMITGLSS
jgi:simple sugar transport system ATP-binding protein